MMQQQVRVAKAADAASLPSNVYETPGGEEYVIEVPVPGIKPDEIVIEVTVGTVTVSIEPKPEDETGRKYFQREQSLRPMSRIFEFPMDLDTDNVRATLENGMLKIHVPKAIAARRKVIRIGQSS